MHPRMNPLQHNTNSNFLDFPSPPQIEMHALQSIKRVNNACTSTPASNTVLPKTGKPLEEFPLSNPLALKSTEGLSMPSITQTQDSTYPSSSSILQHFHRFLPEENNNLPRLPPDFQLRDGDYWVANVIKTETERSAVFQRDYTNSPSNPTPQLNTLTYQHKQTSPLPFSAEANGLPDVCVEKGFRNIPSVDHELSSTSKQHVVEDEKSVGTFSPLSYNKSGSSLLPWANVPRATNKWCCTSCSYQFAYKDHLARHRAFVHEGKSESKCSHCSKIYVEFKSLRRHINVS